VDRRAAGFAARHLGYHHHIAVAELSAPVAEALANEAFDPVAINGTRRCSPGYGHAETRTAGVVLEQQDREIAVRDSSGTPEHPPELPACGEAGRAGEGLFATGPARPQTQGVRRARPLARRRARILRPFLVAMRARKP